jgi:uridine phosphorylase
MGRIPESELIINERGAIYHLNVRPDEMADTIITVGDPDRVPLVSRYFDKVECRLQHREFVTHTGWLGSQRISVVATGIGPDNIDIVMNELDALVNIDFETRQIKPNLTRLRIIRIGTSGSLQADIPVDSYVASTYGIGLDNLMNFYRQEHHEEEKQLLHAFITQTQLHHNISQPYINSAAASLLRNFVTGFHQGITVTCPGFYGPQGRVLRIGIQQPDLIDLFTGFRFGNHRISNFEMETSAIYGLGRAMGHYCLSLNAIIANRVEKKFSAQPQQLTDNLIKKTIETLANM